MLQLYLQDIWWKEEDDIPKKKASGKVKRKEIKNQPHFRGWVIRLFGPDNLFYFINSNIP